MRSILRRYSRNMVFKRKLPRRYGKLPIYVTPDAGLKFWSYSADKWDAELFRLCDEFVKPGAIVWDVGANLGLFSFAAAVRSGSDGYVLAIEPDMFLGNLLEKSYKGINNTGIAKFNVLPMAISKCVGPVEFNIAKNNRATNFLSDTGGVPLDAGGIRESKTIMATTLDWLLEYYPAPSIIKLDVERAEIQALQGASKILENVRPTIIIECGLEPRFKDMVGNIFNQNQYRLYNAHEKPHERKVLTEPTWNTIAIPEERLS